jgi:hypothetical protein
MTGFVLHPGHHELHGITVVVETTGPITYVARFDTQDERGVHLLNVALHDGSATGPTLDEFLARTRRFGVKAERKHLVLPADTVQRIRKLADLP